MDRFEIVFEFKNCMERFNVESVLPKYCESVVELVKNFDDSLIKEIFRDASKVYDESKKIPTEEWWIKYANAKLSSWNTRNGKFRVVMPQKPSESEREKVCRMAREAAERFGFKEEDQNSVINQKVLRYKSYVTLDLVRIDEIGYPLYGDWVPRAEAKGISIHCPKQWLIDNANRKNRRSGVNIGNCVDTLASRGFRS